MAVPEDADIIAEAVALLLEHRVDEARSHLSSLSPLDTVPLPAFDATKASDRPTRSKPQPLGNTMRARVYKRDGWRCRYCHRKLVLPPVLELLTSLCPGFKGLLPGHHMPSEKTEPAVLRVYPNVDHIQAVAVGGSWRDQANHVTACTPCNTRKSDRLGWVPAEPRLYDDWDGLTRLYGLLAEHAAPLTTYHRRWLKALGMHVEDIIH